jgi:hypothetical protein
MNKKPVVTVTEAMNLLGVKTSSLRLLEKQARVRFLPSREGYAVLELRRLLIAAREALSSY